MRPTTSLMNIADAIASRFFPTRVDAETFRVTPVSMGDSSLEFVIVTTETGKGIEFEVIVNRKEMEPLQFTRPCQAQIVRRITAEKVTRFEKTREVELRHLGKNQLRYRFWVTPAEVCLLRFEIDFPDNPSFYFNLRDFVPEK